ncbi:MAG TPA: glycosyltransferase family A protein, partial [Acidobacteriota bacterium]|nr:glycosyltransferase family A protein [Acidobacteriota bacterium]
MDLRVSVILPFRNAESTIAECLDSVLKQTLQEIEIVALNDGSTDESVEIVRQFGRKNPRLRLVEPGPIGLVAALNLGLAEARAPLVARMDADDIMHTERLALQEAYLREHSDIALVSCRVGLFPVEDVRNGYREYERWQNECLTPADIADNLYVESPH